MGRTNILRIRKNTEKILSFARQNRLDSVESLLRFPKYVQIETSALCNGRCRMCPTRELERMKGQAIMTDQVFTRIVRDLRPFAKWIERLTIHGEGEPLCDLKLEQRIRRLKSIGIKFVAFSSNGSLFTPKRSARILACGVDEVTFSIDGATAKTFELIRRPLNFAACIANIERFIALRNAKRSGTAIRIRMTLQERNRHEFKDFLSFWRERLGPKDSAYGKIWHSWANWLKDWRSPEQEGRATLNTSPCISPFGTMFILSDGRVSLCCQDFNAKILLGDLREATFKEIWQGEVISGVRRQHLEQGRGVVSLCRDCNLWETSAKLTDK